LYVSCEQAEHYLLRQPSGQDLPCLRSSLSDGEKGKEREWVRHLTETYESGLMRIISVSAALIVAILILATAGLATGHHISKLYTTH
jgi:hypothetical protein